MSRYTLTRSAELDIAEIWDHVAADNPSAADSLMDQFYGRFRRLSRMPRMGAVHPDLEGEVRFAVVGQYVILYKAREDDVLVLRILHGRRDIRLVFRDEPIDEEQETD